MSQNTSLFTFLCWEDIKSSKRQTGEKKEKKRRRTNDTLATTATKKSCLVATGETTTHFIDSYCN